MSKFEKLGEICGYPKCCINSFCKERITAFNSSMKQKIATTILHDLKFTGYIPCEKCSNDILNNKYKKLIDLININNRNLKYEYEYKDPRISKNRIEKIYFPKINDVYYRVLLYRTEIRIKRQMKNKRKK
jgi:hypothetical protein